MQKDVQVLKKVISRPGSPSGRENLDKTLPHIRWDNIYIEEEFRVLFFILETWRCWYSITW
jgi:hypothetical protein